MSLRFANFLRLHPILMRNTRGMASGEWGSGSGKGGGSGGTIRESGGAFGKIEAAREEEYFRKLQALQLKEYKTHLDGEIAFHEQQIKNHQEAIARHNLAKKQAEDLHNKKP